MGRGNKGNKGKGGNPYRGDAFTKKAKQEGYAARSVYKLSEIDRRFRVLNGRRRVVDLGCSPGSWAAYVIEKIGKKASFVGVDINPPEISGFQFLHRSVLEVTADELIEALDGRADAVLSDMAPLTMGDALRDHFAQLELATCARDLALATLAPGGHFVCKVFDGEDAHDFVMSIRPHFETVKRVRPEAVRKNSREFFLVGLNLLT